MLRLLSDELRERIIAEQQEYKCGLLKLKKEEIIDRAYEIAFLDSITDELLLGMFEQCVNDNLLKLPNPVGVIYDEWIHSEDDISDMLVNIIDRIGADKNE